MTLLNTFLGRSGSCARYAQAALHMQNDSQMDGLGMDLGELDEPWGTGMNLEGIIRRARMLRLHARTTDDQIGHGRVRVVPRTGCREQAAGHRALREPAV